MARIMLDQVQIGMVLEQPVTNSNGRVMIPAGCELSEKHIKAMKMWGVVDVSVKGGEAEATPGTDIGATELESAKAALADLFRHTDLANPVMAEIFKQAVLCHARKR